MKKFIILVALLPLALFSYEISFNKKFSQTVTPDLLTTYISINIDDDDENFINEKIDIFNNFITNDSKVNKKNGSFTLSPKYRYYKDKQEFTGYVGILRYKIEAKNAKNINSFTNELIAIKKKIDSRKVKLNISNVSWIISQDLQEKSLDALRINVIKWIGNYSNTLSSSLNKKCEIKNININRSAQNFLRAEAAGLASMKTRSDIAPVNSDKEISINPNFILECK